MINFWTNKYWFLVIVNIFIINGSFSQEIPPVEIYSPNFYDGGGNQNWMLSQDSNFFIYSANNEGLLEFNGSTWKLYPSPNESIIRAVKAIGNRIYTGCYMEFGYWDRQPNGTLLYTSLSETIKDKLIEDEHFWNIINLDHWIIFQSFSRIYIYDTLSKKFQFVDGHHYIFKCFNVNNTIFFQAVGEGLFEIINGKGKLISDDESLKNNRIVAIYTHENGILLQTERAGIFKFENNVLKKHPFISEALVNQNTIFTSLQLSDGGFALGTISNGIYILDQKGLIKHHITQTTGLGNNTILSIFEDADKNLWLGLDNGINCINLQSPIQNYKDDIGFLGTIYVTIKYKNGIYIGTNQGLYHRDINRNENYTLINGTKGQVWTLFEFDGVLFCGHDLGTFIVDGKNANLIFKGTGTWKFNNIPNRTDILMQGNYNGLSILEKSKNGDWQFRNKIKGFDISSRYFELSNQRDIYIGHEYKGIIKIESSEDYREIKHIQILNSPEKGKHMSLIKYNGTVYFAGKQGIFKLDNNLKKFVIDTNLSEVFKNNEYISGKLIIDNSNKMWLFTKNYMYYFTSGNFSTDLNINKIPIPYSYTKAMLGYENITQISNNEYIIGKTNGYFILNLDNFKVNYRNISLSNVNVNKLDKSAVNLSINELGELKHDENNLTFNYTVPIYNRFINIEYQYKLEGFQNQWSEWSTKSSVNFKNLPSGEYEFKVRAKVANEKPEYIATYAFEINKPWYFNDFIVLLYVLLLVVMVYFIHKYYNNFYHSQREKLIEENNRLLEIKELENEQELMKLKNEQLTLDVDTKNRELAVSTMSLIKKNELLELIKEDLKKTTEDKGNDLKYVLQKISRNITEENTWDVFREAYDNLDKDFLKKTKERHPSLTPSDLKLCAYLRLNLSSKEIAPMLHISIRSVEIKRYRLRKKLNLDHEESLVSYILGL